MSKIIVVGTLAFDTIETPFGKVERVIGGSAPFAGLAAKTKDVECAIISIIGGDFPKSYLDILTSKKIDISEVIERISIKTRQYAKRQVTWARGNMINWNKISSDDLNKFLKKI